MPGYGVDPGQIMCGNYVHNETSLPSVTISHIRMLNLETSNLGGKTEKYNDFEAIRILHVARSLYIIISQG